MTTPTLKANWTPTKQGCLRTNDFWIWDYQEGPKAVPTVLGGPTQTTDCFPTTWDPTVTYAGSACPGQYTSACQGADSAVTCCPNAYAFKCQPATEIGNRVESFRCTSQHTSGGKIVVTRTAFVSNTIHVETRTRSTSEHLYALGMMYTVPTSSATDSTTLGGQTTDSSSTPESTSETSSQTGSTALSPGQAAGIGVGAGVAVLLVAALVAWLFWRRRRSSKAVEQPRPKVDEYYIDSPPPLKTPMTPRELPGFREPSELNAIDTMQPQTMYELPAK
ncbi:hypothetical protein F4779DRAFT_265442 [Xylariaceae sp. FL0662B]|nr:hypothetical protein F4779DRAFT_265442 [Xylariaceae sp. FL0662B]